MAETCRGILDKSGGARPHLPAAGFVPPGRRKKKHPPGALLSPGFLIKSAIVIPRARGQPCLGRVAPRRLAKCRILPSLPSSLRFPTLPQPGAQGGPARASCSRVPSRVTSLFSCRERNTSAPQITARRGGGGGGELIASVVNGRGRQLRETRERDTRRRCDLISRKCSDLRRFRRLADQLTDKGKIALRAGPGVSNQPGGGGVVTSPWLAGHVHPIEIY